MKALHLLPISAVLLASCGGLQQTAEVYDGVYDKPRYEPTASTAPVKEEEPKKADDYYDSNTASQYQRGYYDMAYNDPYYYNYGRFGFGTGLSYGSYGAGWGQPCYGSGWGSSYGWGSNYYGWNDPWSYGYSGYGWNSPYSCWGSPYNGWNDPWYGGYGGYYGGGPYSGYGYYGYGGGCYSCYYPIVVYGSPMTIAHRPTLGAGGNTVGTGGGTEGSTRMGTMKPPYTRSLVSLRPEVSDLQRPTGILDRGTMVPVRGTEQRPPLINRDNDRRGDRSRNEIHRGDGGGRNDGGSAPTRDTGGGGGTRTSPMRPR